MKKILTFLALCLLTVEVFGQASALNPYWMKWKIQGGSYRTKKQIVVPGLNMSLSQTNDSLTITLDTAAVTAAGYSKLGQSIDSTEITDNTVSEPDLHISNGTTNGLVLKWLDASGLTWSTDLSGGAADSSTFASYIKPFGDNDDTLYWLGDTLLAASGLTSKVIFAPSVAADTLILGRDGKTLTDSLQVVRGYVDIKILTGTTAPAATYMRIYPVGDTLWAKTSDNDSFNLTRAGAGGGADTLVLWVLGAGAYPGAAHRIRFLQGTGASLTATGDTSLEIATSLGTSIGTVEIEANAVDGTKVAITSQATGDIIYYDGTDWVVQGTHASNTVLHGNDAAAPTFSAVVSADITDGTVDSMDIATGAIKSAEIFNNTIIAEDIASNVITASEIATDGVGQDELANGSVGTGEIIDGTIDSTDIGDNKVSEADLHISNGTTDGLYLKWLDASGMTWAAGGAGGGDSSWALAQADTLTASANDSILVRDEVRFDSGAYFRTDIKAGGNLDINAISDTSLSGNVSLLGQTIEAGEIANRIVDKWFYPEYAQDGAATGPRLRGDEYDAIHQKFLGAAYYPTWGDTLPASWKDTLGMVWHSVDSFSNRNLNVLIFYTLDNFDSWVGSPDTALMVQYSCSTANQTLDVKYYKAAFKATDSTWAQATDSSGNLTNAGWTWFIDQSIAGSWTAGDVLVLRLTYFLGTTGVIGQSYVKTGRIRIRYNAKS